MKIKFILYDTVSKLLTRIQLFHSRNTVPGPADPAGPQRAGQVAGGDGQLGRDARDRVRGQQGARRQPQREAPHEARRVHLPQLRPGREVSCVATV